MGLDIYFYRVKREGYEEAVAKYNEATKTFEAYFKELVDKYGDHYYEEGHATREELDKLDELHNAVPDMDEVEEEIGYFRKVNFIIPFFGYQEDCSEQEITVSELKELVRRCNIVLEEKREEVSIEELPTTSGFFFGNTDYDDYYYDDVEAVRDWANGVIESADETEYKLLLVCWW